MSFTLYDATVPGFIRVCESTLHAMKLGRDYCRENALNLEDILDERLCGDMLPFSFQIKSVCTHTIGAINGATEGVFSPIPPMSQPDYTQLEEMLAVTISELKALDPSEVNSLGGGDVMFSMKEIKIPFTVEGFFMSFSIPNMHFHATTAYDILRMKGVPLGKRVYLGNLDIKQS
ncbi:DUF1993 domain-containing protein [Ponticaulis sp.]|uniref:DUF1993 domain-containing protein n=1 Tax=Ponticaulis sp. TaxID=2020902 RepID=UPI0025D7CE14|nr:DUF1993 domain-containing protein [Ponticaulis sp.]